MSEAARIRRNSAFSFLSAATRLLANMLMFIGVARFYGPEVFGQFTTAHIYYTLFLVLADFGYDLLVATEVARAHENSGEVVQGFLPAKLLFSVGATVCMWIVTVLSAASAQTKGLMFLFSTGIMGNALANFLFAAFKGREQLHHETYASFLQNAALLLALLVLGWLKVHISVVVVVFVLSRYLGLGMAMLKAPRVIQLRTFSMSLSSIRERVVQCFPFGINLLFGTLLFQMDTLMISAWLGDHQAGVYQAVIKIISLILVASDVIINALLPVLTRLYVDDRRQWLRLSTLLGKTLTFVALPFSVVLFLYPEKIISLIYGSMEFSSAAPVLRLFALTLLVRYAVEVYGLMLTTGRRQSSRASAVVIATVVNAALNIYAIPRFGVVGAGVVALVTSLVTGVVYIVAVRWRMEVRGSLWDKRQIAVLSFAAVLIVAANVFSLPPLLGIALVGLLFLGVFYVVGFTGKERVLVFSISRGES